jgi:hypothetical protein
MEILVAILVIVAICLGPTALYLAYTRNRPEPFLDRK